MNFIKSLLAGLVVMTALASCESASTQGQYSVIDAGLSQNVDLDINTAWQKTYDTLSANTEIISDDHVQKEATVVLYGTKVKIKLTALNEVTTLVEVSSRKYLMNQQAHARIVFSDIIEALTQD